MKNFKNLITGVLILFLIFSSISVYALTGTKSIDVIYDNIKVTLDGKTINMDAEPFEYNGITYVPVESVSKALGANAKWNSKTKTVEITNSSSKSSNSSTDTSKTPTVTPQAPEKKEITVYITKTGAKYHSSGCRYLSKSKISISLESAKRSYSPCSVCNPPR